MQQPNESGMKEIQSANAEFMVKKKRQEENRRAYLLRKHGAAGVCELQQQAIGDLAELWPDLAQRHRHSKDKQLS